MTEQHQARQKEIYDATFSLLLQKSKLAGVDPALIESFAFGIATAELLNQENGSGYNFLRDSCKVALYCLGITSYEFESLLDSIKFYSGK